MCPVLIRWKEIFISTKFDCLKETDNRPIKIYFQGMDYFLLPSPSETNTHGAQ